MKAAVLKTARVESPREFESPPLRSASSRAYTCAGKASGPDPGIRRSFRLAVVLRTGSERRRLGELLAGKPHLETDGERRIRGVDHDLAVAAFGRRGLGEFFRVAR